MSEEEQAAEEGSAPAKPGMMLVIAGLLGGLVIGGLGGSFALGPMLAKKFAAPKSAEAATAEDKEAEEGKSGGEHGEKKAGAVVHMMENLVLNPSGSNGTRFLMAAVAAEVKDEKVKEEMTGRDAELRDAALRILGVRTVEQLADMALREGLKKELVDSLNARLASKSAVKRIYFPQFVIQ
jgi:flagellar FliL protein